MRLLFKVSKRINYYLDILNIFYLRKVKGVKIGNNCRISRKSLFSVAYGSVRIGENCIIEPNVRIKVYDRNNINTFSLDIERNVFLGYGSIIDSNERVIIEKSSMIGPYVFITDSNHILKNKNVPIALQGGEYKATIIRQNSWIGSHCQILAGVIIGSNSIIAANSTVIKSTNEDSLYAGSPAVFKRSLF